MKFTTTKYTSGKIHTYRSSELLNGEPVRIRVGGTPLLGKHYIIKHPSLATDYNTKPIFYNLASAKAFVATLFN